MLKIINNFKNSIIDKIANAEVQPLPCELEGDPGEPETNADTSATTE